VSLSDAVTFTFGATTLAPNARIVLAVNPDAFAARYGGSIAVAGQYVGQFNNAGERVVLSDARGATILDFTYDDEAPDWHPTTDGDGFSLVLVNELGPVASWSDGASWRPSSAIGGSPGSADATPGDVNGDRRVDLVDLAILQAHLGVASGATRPQGDLDGDGGVDRTDAAILARNFGRASVAASPAAAIVAIAASRQRAALAAPTNDYAARARRADPRAANGAAVDEAIGGLSTVSTRRNAHRRAVARDESSGAAIAPIPEG
jgi:hypothetical protein